MNGRANFRTTFGKIIRKAGVEPWPRLWHSLSASCELDLAQSFPLAVVTKWLGNTPSVALRHYVDPTDAAFDQETGWLPNSGAKSGTGNYRRQSRRNETNNGKRYKKRLFTRYCESLRYSEPLCTGVYGNRTHWGRCSRPPQVLKTWASASRANTPNCRKLSVHNFSMLGERWCFGSTGGTPKIKNSG